MRPNASPHHWPGQGEQAARRSSRRRPRAERAPGTSGPSKPSRHASTTPELRCPKRSTIGSSAVDSRASPDGRRCAAIIDAQRADSRASVSADPASVPGASKRVCHTRLIDAASDAKLQATPEPRHADHPPPPPKKQGPAQPEPVESGEGGTDLRRSRGWVQIAARRHKARLSIALAACRSSSSNTRFAGFEPRD